MSSSFLRDFIDFNGFKVSGDRYGVIESFLFPIDYMISSSWKFTLKGFEAEEYVWISFFFLPFYFLDLFCTIDAL